MKTSLILALLSLATTISAAPRLSFKDGKFRILQLTDIHWDAGSEKCSGTAASIKAVIDSARPDLIVLTGDIVTAAPAREGWNDILSLLDNAGIPFAMVNGNHDAEFMQPYEIYGMLAQSEYFVGERGPEEISGYGNYVLPVYSSDGSGKAALLVYCLDSNDYPEDKFYGHYNWIQHDQIEWYRHTSSRYAAENSGTPLPALAFFHIGLPEYADMSAGGQCYGHNTEGGGYPRINSGMFASFVEMKDVMGVFVGHDHDNDFIGQEYGIALAYGRVSGYDAYGTLERGGRVIEIAEGRRQFDTWIATPSGNELCYYYPSGITSDDENGMEYLPSQNAAPTEHGARYTYYEGRFKKTSDIAGGKIVKTGKVGTFDISGAPAEDHFAYEFTAYIDIPERGVYNFYTVSDDGSCLYIDGKPVVDNDGSHNSRRRGGKAALEKGLHHIRVVYFEDYMGEELDVRISGRNMPEQTVGTEMIFTD